MMNNMADNASRNTSQRAAETEARIKKFYKEKNQEIQRQIVSKRAVNRFDSNHCGCTAGDRSNLYRPFCHSPAVGSFLPAGREAHCVIGLNQVSVASETGKLVWTTCSFPIPTN